MQKCQKAGMDTPAVYHVDMHKAIIYMERVIGITVKQRLLDGQATGYADIDQGKRINE